MLHSSTSELYVDYLIAHKGLVGTGDMSDMLGGTLSHNHITRTIAQPQLGQKAFCQLVKPSVRAVEHDDGSKRPQKHFVEALKECRKVALVGKGSHGQGLFLPIA
ncbi:MAG: hypothetical protein ACKVUS_16530 [Saprospiraceae bacterium]